MRGAVEQSLILVHMSTWGGMRWLIVYLVAARVEEILELDDVGVLQLPHDLKLAILHWQHETRITQKSAFLRRWSH